MTNKMKDDEMINASGYPVFSAASVPDSAKRAGLHVVTQNKADMKVVQEALSA